MAAKATELIEQEEIDAVEPRLEGRVAVSLPAILLGVKESGLCGVSHLEPGGERLESETIEERGLAVPRLAVEEDIRRRCRTITSKPLYRRSDSGSLILCIPLIP